MRGHHSSRGKITSQDMSPHTGTSPHRRASHLIGGGWRSPHIMCPLTQGHSLTFSLLTHGITFHGGRAITSKDVSPLHEDISHRGTPHKGEGIASHRENHLMMCPLIQEDIPSHGVTSHHHISWRGRDITSHYVPPQMGTSHMTCYLTHTSPHTRCLLTQKDISSHKASHFMGEEKSPHMMCPSQRGHHSSRGEPPHAMCLPHTGGHPLQWGGASHLMGVRGDHLTLHVTSHKRTCHMGGGSISSHMGEPPHTMCPLTKGNISHGGHHCSQGEKSPHMMCPLTQEAIPSHGGVGITFHRGGG